MPVILTKPDEIEEWMTAPAKDALRLRQALPDDALRMREGEAGLSLRGLFDLNGQVRQ